MRFLQLPSALTLLLLPFLSVCDADDKGRTSCATNSYTSEQQSPDYFNKTRDHDLQCLPPLDELTIITPERHFLAVPCLHCPVLLHPPDDHFFEVIEDSILLYNVSLSAAGTELLLNDIEIFPDITAAYRRPPPITSSQLSPKFSGEDLNAAITCSSLPVPRGSTPTQFHAWCIRPKYKLLELNYDYSVYELSRENDVVKWEINFDAFGSNPSKADSPWTFDHKEQKMMQITVTGVELERKTNKADQQAAASLFGPFGGKEEVSYALQIERIDVVPRQYKFPSPPSSSAWNKFRHFFGFDRPDLKGHIVYDQAEWDQYGKKNTLRNALGFFIYEWPWAKVFSIIAGVIGGLLGVYGIYRLILIIIEQRRLAKWGGMDEVWERIRQVGSEEDGLLDDGTYRDDPDEPPRYTDEVQVNKPLPSKPLPEKPLPEVPLIDGV